MVRQCSYECLPQLSGQIDQPRSRRPARIDWESEPSGDEGPEVKTYTYRELYAEVCRFANRLKSLGVIGIVTIYMGMVPELTIAVLTAQDRAPQLRSSRAPGFAIADWSRTRRAAF